MAKPALHAVFVEKDIEERCQIFFETVEKWIKKIEEDNTSISSSLETVMHSGHPPFFFLQGGVEPPTKFSKKGGLTGPQLLEGGCWERGGWQNLVRVAIFNKNK